jgi:sulfur-carrier protein
MQVLFKIPGPLREFTGHQSTVCIEVEAGANLLEVLQALFVVSPGLRDRVLTETGETRRHVNIFVGIENVRYTGGLATAIYDGAEVSIVPAITGG